MKVVVGSCIGGFYPSIELMKRLIAIDSPCIIKQPFSPEDVSDWYDESLTDCGDGFFVFDWPNSLTDNEFLYGFSWQNEVRANPELVALVEEMSLDAAHPGYEISIAEIPDDVKWEISTNEMGVEFVSERHRVWFGNR